MVVSGVSDGYGDSGDAIQLQLSLKVAKRLREGTEEDVTPTTGELFAGPLRS